MEVNKKVLFNTPFLRVKDCGEKNSGEVITEQAGYVSAEQQIKNIMRSGEQLMLFRKGLYQMNFGGKTDEEAFENADPTLNPDFDVIDAGELLKSERERLDEKYRTEDKLSDGVVVDKLGKGETEKVSESSDTE